MEDALKGGKGFDETLGKSLSDKKGKGGEEGNYLKEKDLLPEIAEAVSKMKIGSTSAVVKIKTGFVIFKLEDVRFPENPTVKEQVRMELLRKNRKSFHV
jgi:parvulin-like peptidyl-prolyl isomerase